MQEKHLFEYAAIRIVPRVEREEFMNVGVILYCQSQRFLQVRFYLNADRLKCFSAELELEVLDKNLHAFDKICKGGKEGGPIGQQAISARFRWLTATRSTILQTSAVHLGLCTNPEETLERLYQQLVL